MNKVFISVGHGGTDPGTTAVDGTYEKNIALEIALYVRDELKRHNIETEMSREKDEDDKLDDEVAECNSYAPNIGVSIHLNSCATHNAQGFEIWHSINSKSKGILLAQKINDAVIHAGYKSRGLKSKANSQGKDYFGWIRKTNAPVVLCELAFIDNKQNYSLIDETSERKAMAVCLAKGILDYFGIKYVENTTEKDKSNILSNKIYAVQCGAFSIKTNAENLAKKLRNDGYDAIIVEK